MLAHSGMLATTRAILLGMALTWHYECLVHDCNLQSNLWVPKPKSYQEKRKPGFCESQSYLIHLVIGDSDQVSANNAVTHCAWLTRPK